MAGFSGQKHDAPIVGINVTPLVDITLVLLIIFMVTAKIVVSRALPMNLPKAATGAEVQQIFSVTLEDDGRLFLDGEPIASQAVLAERARAALVKHPDLRAVIAADGQVRHERVMGALDTLRHAGLERVAFAVKPGPSPTAEPSPVGGAPGAEPAPAAE